MDSKDYVKRFKAARRLLSQKEVSLKTLKEIQTLVKGFDPKVDKALDSCLKTAKTIKQIKKGKVVELSEKIIKKLPAQDKKQKKRKKALLLLFKLRRQLRSEIKRVTKAYESATQEGDLSVAQRVDSAKKISKLFTKAKGPLGLVTLLAAGIVGGRLLLSYLNANAAEVVVKNQGCQPITPVISRPVSLPGLKLPSQTIPDGGQGVATLPPLKLTVDGTQKGLIKVKALFLTMNFELESEGIDLVFNGQTLLGNRTSINLKQASPHELVVLCK
jgi:hypothetical protein